MNLKEVVEERRVKTLSQRLDLADQFVEAQGGTNLTKLKNINSEIAGKTDSRDARFYLKGSTKVLPVQKVSCVRASSDDHLEEQDDHGFVELKGGEKIPVVNAVMRPPPDRFAEGTPVLPGKVAGRAVSVLCDTGASTVIVKRDLVQDEELTGTKSAVFVVDGTIRFLPEAKVTVDTPYYSGEVTALCMKDPLYDLILGNIQGVREAENPESLTKIKGQPVPAKSKRHEREEATVAAVTREESKDQGK
ncbi:uncharacterized protein LOC144125877 [Amblyomma americanum]